MSTSIERKIPRLKQGLRYTLDRDRGVWLLHTQQGTLLPPPESTEIMGLLDGQRDVGAIVDHMADSSGRARAEVAAEVARFLADLQQRGVILLQ